MGEGSRELDVERRKRCIIPQSPPLEVKFQWIILPASHGSSIAFHLQLSTGNYPVERTAVDLRIDLEHFVSPGAES